MRFKNKGVKFWQGEQKTNVQDVLEGWKGRPEWSRNISLGRISRFSCESDESKQKVDGG